VKFCGEKRDVVGLGFHLQNTEYSVNAADFKQTHGTEHKTKQTNKILMKKIQIIEHEAVSIKNGTCQTGFFLEQVYLFF
jgi:hypothetical protein